jgi:hypothetical protein
MCTKSGKIIRRLVWIIKLESAEFDTLGLPEMPDKLDAQVRIALT